MKYCTFSSCRNSFSQYGAVVVSTGERNGKVVLQKSVPFGSLRVAVRKKFTGMRSKLVVSRFYSPTTKPPRLSNSQCAGTREIVYCIARRHFIIGADP